MSLSVLGCKALDIGQLVRVKKLMAIEEKTVTKFTIGEKKVEMTISLRDITYSTVSDFFVKKVNKSIHLPKQLDMAIMSSNLNDGKHKKGYQIMEHVPENTAEKVFREKKIQKWEYQKTLHTRDHEYNKGFAFKGKLV